MRGSICAKVPTAPEIAQVPTSSRAVSEVKDVENLLHLPKTPAKSSKPRRQQAKPSPGLFNTEVRTAESEPTPSELAARGSGRTPPPMGSQE